MNYFYILSDCNSTLGTCCKDYGIAKILSIYDSVFTMIQIFVPILLMVMAAAQLFKMLIDPDDKKGKKSLYNKFIAAAIVFFLPLILNLLINIVTDSVDISKYETLSCLKEAKETSGLINMTSTDYAKPSKPQESRTPFIIDPSKYKGKGTNKNPNATAGTYSLTEDDNEEDADSDSGEIETSSEREKIVAYAKKFLGKKYVYGGSWNGSPNYTPTDCSGFVQGVYAHFGYHLPRATSGYPNGAVKRISESELQAGDLVLYYGHIAMLTGNGKQIIHASSPKNGICLKATYKYRNIKAFYRVKGVK